MENVIDAIAAGETPANISQEIKDILFSKASERIDTYKGVVATRLFDGDEAEEGEEWYSSFKL